MFLILDLNDCTLDTVLVLFPICSATQDPPLLQPATSSEGPSFASESSNGVLEEEAGIRRMQGTSGKNASAAATAIAIEKYQQQLLDYDDEEEEDDEEGMTVGGYASSPKEGKVINGGLPYIILHYIT